MARIERAIRILEHHLERAAERRRAGVDRRLPHLGPRQPDAPGRRRLEPGQDLGQRRLPAPRLADDAEGLAGPGDEADAVQRADDAAADPEDPVPLAIELAELLDLEDGRPCRARRRRRGPGMRALPPPELLGANAPDAVPVLARERLARDRPARAALGHGVRAARGEAAARRAPEGAVDLAGDGGERRVAPVAAERGQAVEEAARVGMARVAEDLADRSLLDELAGVHDAHPVADADDGAQVVADEQDGRVVAPAQRADQVEHGRLHGDVEPGGRLVQDEERRLGDQRHRDHDALLLAARELVRVPAEHALGIRQVDLGQHPERAPAGLGGADPGVGQRHLHELAAHRHHRVEARRRVLVDHRDAAPADRPQLALVHPREVAPLEEDPASHQPPRRAEVADDGERHRRLAASRLADQPDRLSGVDGQAERGDDVELPRPREVGDADAVQREDRRGPPGVSHGGRARAGRWPGG